ncbi:uncharacterized protein LOC143465660 [Clavelina lepadiformis]|uniref:uncharacterized protein LOC143465660 n=1 Tax=Clavelina lepadiformis TaxID=159417 RepID=UPI0040433EF5
MCSSCCDADRCNAADVKKMQLTPFANSNARRKIVKSFHKEMIFFSARHPQGGIRKHTAALFHMSALCVVGRSGSSPRTEQRNLRNYELNWLGSLQRISFIGTETCMRRQNSAGEFIMKEFLITRMC